MPISQPDGFLAQPATANGKGVLVLHAWWGLNETIRTFCTRLAEAGFVVFAPDLYHGKIAKTIPEAEVLGHAIDANFQQAITEVAGAAEFLGKQPGVDGHDLAVIGFSLGAFYALCLAADDPEHFKSVVVFYGTADVDTSASQAEYLGHFAENDPYEPSASADALEAYLKRLGRPVTFYHYPGTGHWFFEPDRTEQYNEAAAKLAWDRTLAFLTK